MTDVAPRAGIGEDELGESAPLVRALVVSRLEMIWRTCQPHVDGSAGRPDPRYVEAGIRVLDRLMRLYRLDAPQTHDEGPTEASGTAALVESQLAELEQRLKPDAQ